ncbi:epoxide hydrolase family protein [Paraburkholderia youngii]|uniref:epoxide hydrolase family protein n=1 Tax=Paraburkholderia youngii TaxID=2782701 RepID=UPI003D1C27BD
MPSKSYPDSAARRRFFSVAAATAAGTLLPFDFAQTSQAATEATIQSSGQTSRIHPFRVHFSDVELTELRRRIRMTRWPDRETVQDDSQGVRLAMMQELAHHWATDYDWRKCEAKLNALPQYVTEIDGLDIHFIHVRSRHENALPLIVTHGWPGSIVEQLKIIGPLVNPTAFGGSASDAFNIVIPSLPGYGFSAKPTTAGWGPERIARAWVELMTRLGYTRFVSQGGDWGAIVSNVMAKQAPPELLGIHVNLPATVPPEISKALQNGSPPPASLSSDEKLAYEQLGNLYSRHLGYALEMKTRPQTLYGLADSPIALAAWLLDHGDGYAQPATTLTSAVLDRTEDGHSAGELTRDDVLDNITLYWLTNTGISSARIYWESHLRALDAADVSIPAAVTVFPGELYQAPRSWTEQAYHKLNYYSRPAYGGHVAAWEQPQLFAEEVRAGFRHLRT